MMMYGYPYPPRDVYADAIGNHDGFASLGKQWHTDASAVAGRSPKLAARMRDVAKAYSDLAFLCVELKREAASK